MRSVMESVGRNAGVMMASQVVTWASAFLLMLVLPRYLGSEEYGRLFLALSISAMALVFIEFGGQYFIAKEVSRDRTVAPSLIANSIGLRIALGALSLILVFLLAAAAGYERYVLAMILILTLAKLWEGPLTVVIAALQGFERMEYRSIISIVERVVLSVVAVSALMLGARAIVVATIMACSTLISFFVGAHFLRRLVPSIPFPDWRTGWSLVRQGIPYVMLSVFGVIYFRINAVMLSFQVPPEVVGWFGAAFRLFDVMMFFPSILSTALLPVLVRVAGNTASFLDTTRKTLEVTILAALPMAIGTWAFADDIVPFLFGTEEFSGSAAVLRMLVCGLPLVYVDVVLVTALVAMDSHTTWSRVAFGAIPVSVGLNWILIPLFQEHFGNGGVGSALATNLTEAGIMMAAIILLPRGVFSVQVFARLWRVSAAGLCMIAVLWALRALQAPWLAQAGGCVAAFAAAAIGLRAVVPRELDYLRSFLSLRGLRGAFMADDGGPS